MTADFVLIAPQDRLSELTALLRREGAVDAYADSDAVAALDAAFRTLPRMVVLERGFAESLPGRALVRRLTDDPFGRECLVRVIDALPAGTVAPADATGTTASPAAVTASPAAARATARRQVRPDSVATVDGTTMQIVDISTEGMQVVGALTLKPNQAVRVTVPAPDLQVKLHARVAWATLELGGPQAGLRYRAGLAFVDAEVATLTRVVAWMTAGLGEG